MEELYKIMEQTLETGYKLECVENVLSLQFDKMENVTKAELLSVIAVAGDSVRCIADMNKAAVAALDRYIASNACRERNGG